MNLEQRIDQLIIAHNLYIDGIWKGTSDFSNPPQTAKAILELITEARTEEAKQIYELWPKPWDYEKMTKAQLLDVLANNLGVLELDAYGAELKTKDKGEDK